MPSVSRTFHIPVSPDPSTVKLSIVLREPSLTGDNLGHKTWAASYLLAKRLNLLLPLLPIVPQPSTPVVQLGSFGVSETALHKDGGAQVSAPRVLELGAGTGLVGIAAAAVCATHVDLTDLPEICGNLEKNCQANSTTVKAYGGSLSVFPLDWSDLRSGDSVPADNKYDIILAADPLYSPQHPKLLADTISSYLNLESSSRVVVELPLRDAYQVEIEAFRSLMTQRGLQLLSEGGEIGYDDWEDGTGEVKCWWGIWGWEKVAQAG
ncbi:hypothetical protein MMC19_007054 [Ptychographa xylographoides]|nr:hypothetical protein [Ptychographa xylographoides]